MPHSGWSSEDAHQVACGVPQSRRRWKLRRLTAPDQRLDEKRLSAGAALRLSLWMGLAVGLIELALTVALKPMQDPSPGFFRMNRHILWAIPAFNVALFGACGALLAVAATAWPRRAARITAIVLAGLAMPSVLLSIQPLHYWAGLILGAGLAIRVAMRIEGNLEALKRIVAWSLPVLSVVSAGVAGVSLGNEAFSGERPGSRVAAPLAAGRPAPNVLLIVLDTVRADHLSLYGYERDTTPNLKRLAKRGVTFAQARSTAPWTLPSHASMMTGRWPHELSVGIHRPLDGTHLTLAEHLARNGYSTAGFVANIPYCTAETGLARGFAHYADHDVSALGIVRTSALVRRVIWPMAVQLSEHFGGSLTSENRKDAARITDDLLTWTEQNHDRPYFAFLNLYDAHSSYIPPASFNRHFGVTPENAGDISILNRWFVIDKSTLTSRDVRLGMDSYDDCIAYLDEQLGRMFDELERRGDLSNTLVIVTADHGEHFGEHELYGHASSLYDQEIHVPLMMVMPGQAQAGRVVPSAVSLRDLAATVVDVIGLGKEAPFPGASLAAHWGASPESSAAPTFAEVDGPVMTPPNHGRSPVFRGAMTAVAFGQDVYIRTGDGGEELYDLASDPGQTQNLVKSPDGVAKLERFRKEMAEMGPKGKVTK